MDQKQNTHRTRRHIAFALCFATLLLGACSMKPGKPAGFLGGGYESMTRSTSSKSFKSYIPAPDQLSKYTSIILEPVTVQKHPDAEMKRIDEKELAQLAAYFDAQLKAEFGSRYQIVSRAGKDTLRIRVAITDARGSIAVLNIHYSTLLTRSGVGGGAMEAEFLDSTSGRQVASFMDSRMGNPFGYLDGFSPIGHAKQLVRTWSKDLREALETGKPKAKTDSSDTKRRSNRRRH